MLPTLSRQEQQAVSYYNKKIEQGDTYDHPVWVDDFSQRIFLGLQPDAEVIDVGCGLGRSITMLPELGIDNYFGVDAAESQIAYCRRTFPQFNFEVKDIRDIGKSYPDRFDGFLLLAVLMHIPRGDIDICLQSLRRSLKVGAPGFISFPYSEGEVLEFVSSIADIKCTLFTIDEVSSSLERNGFSIERHRRGEGMFLGHLVAT